MTWNQKLDPESDQETVYSGTEQDSWRPLSLSATTEVAERLVVSLFRPGC